jgi:hypothetical protein
MSEEEIAAIDLVAYYKASTFTMWTDQQMSLINHIAREQAKFATNFALQRVLDQCIDLSEDNDLDLANVLNNHAGWNYYCKILDLIDTIPMDDNDTGR